MNGTNTQEIMKKILTKQGNYLNPMQENILKAVQKVHKQQVEEAMQAGASGEQVLKDAGINFADNQPEPEVDESGVASTDPLSVALTGQQPPELAERPMPKREELFGGFIKESPETYQKRLQNEGLIRSMLGMEPLQKGEKEKIELMADLETINKKAGESLQKPLSAEASEAVANTKMGIKLIDSLSKSFETDPTLFEAIWTAGNPRAQTVRTAVTNIQDVIARMRTGAAINASEEKLYKSLVPMVGLKARYEHFETVKFKLQMLKELFSDVKNNIQPEQRIQKATFLNKALDEGWSPSEIRKYMKGQR